MIDVVNVLLIAFAGASLSNFIDDSLADGMILGRYGNYIRDKNKWWLKPLGLCMRCTNVWVTLFLIICFLFSFKIFFMLSIIGISNTFLNYVNK